MQRHGSAVNVSLDGSIVQDVQCLREKVQAEGGKDDPGEREEVTACTVSIPNVVVGKQACLTVTILNANRRAISSPHMIPFVLHAPPSGSSQQGYRISVLPMRLAHGNRQKIPYSLVMEREPAHDAALYTAAVPAHNGARADAKAFTQDDIGETCRTGACQIKVHASSFHTPPHLVDLSAPDALEKLPDAVWVGGLGRVSLAWPAGHTGPAGRAHVYKVFPISYAAYTDFIRPHPLPKAYDFAPYRPGAMSAFRHLRLYGPLQEAEYFDDYSRSYFGFTRRKAGWDCMRHYEIIAAGAIPYFVNLSQVPSRTMAPFPKALVLEAMSMPGVIFQMSPEGHEIARAEIDHSVFNHSHYFELLGRLHAWTSEHLTTTALAQRILRTMGLHDSMWGSAKVLFMVHPGGFGPAATYDEGGNLRDMLFHGLRRTLGRRLVDAFRMSHMYDDVLPETPAASAISVEEWESEELHARSWMHGWGFFHAGLLESDHLIDRTRIQEQIRSRDFDLVIVGSICHDIIARRELEEVHAEVPDELPYWQGRRWRRRSRGIFGVAGAREDAVLR